MAIAELVMPRVVDLVPRCVFCEKIVGKEAYCKGCENYICSECDVGQCVGKHKVTDHLNIWWGEELEDD